MDLSQHDSPAASRAWDQHHGGAPTKFEQAEADEAAIAACMALKIGAANDGRAMVSDALAEAMTADALKYLTCFLAAGDDAEAGKLIREMVEGYVRKTPAYQQAYDNHIVELRRAA